MTYKYLHGVETELKKLAEFPLRVEVNVSRGAVRAMARVVEARAETLVPRKTGRLAGTLRVSTRKRGGEVTAAVKVGNRKTGVFYGRFVIGGTKPHLIKPRVKGMLGFGGIVRRVVQHPGAKPQPFMQQADLATRGTAIKVGFDYANERLKRLLAAQGNL